MYDHRKKKSNDSGTKKRSSRKRSETKESDDSNSCDSENDTEGEVETPSSENSFLKVEECISLLKQVKDHISVVEESSLKQLEAEIDNIQGKVREEREARIVKMQTAAEDARRQEKESKLCVVCCEKEKSCLFLPCKHLCCCEGCATDRRLTQCPICRKDIDDTVSIFL